MREPGFGIDLAGFSTGKSGFARAQADDEGHIVVSVWDKHPLKTKYTGGRSLIDATRSLQRLIGACMVRGPVAVDIPIDLQGLPNSPTSDHIWGATKRPVDQALGGMPPFADRIGGPVVRFMHLGLQSALGERLFETYPAQSLRELGLAPTGYKNQTAKMEDGEWVGGRLAALLTSLSVVAEPGETLDDDEFDAIICALAVAGDLDYPARRSRLDRQIDAKLGNANRHVQASIRVERLDELISPYFS
ncbi:DUF429 domain-containing protein [Maricaulis sp.]|uniref:DUF429 domain-containing protein n=1 Tax=Maricaulis sp. TaxID=1486257 RepID=UPI003A8D2A9A